MESNRWDRFSPLTGVLAAALWLVGTLILFSDEPDGAASPEELAAYFADDAGRIITGAFIFMLGVAAFLWFVGTLRAELARAEGGVGRIAGIVQAGGVATASMMFAMAAPDAAGALQAQNQDRDPSPEAADALSALGNGFFLGAETAAIVLVAATALAVLRTGIFPRWVAWASLVLGLWLVIGPIGWLGLIVGLPAWTVLVSVLLWRRTPVAGETVAT